MKVFLSHSSQDKWIARQIARAIRDCGSDVFLDEANVDVGGPFEEDIRTYLAEADELVWLATPSALTRPYVWAELGVAWVRRIRIITLVHGMSVADLMGRTDVPVFVKERYALPLDDLDRYLDDLRRRLEQAGGMM